MAASAVVTADLEEVVVRGLTNPARMVVDMKSKELQRLLLELVRKDPDLRDRLIRYGDRKAEYTTLLSGERPDWAIPTEGKP